MPEEKLTYKVGDDIYDISPNQKDEFLADFPKAEELKSFVVDKDTFDISVNDVDEFLADFPNATPTFELKKKEESTPSIPEVIPEQIQTQEGFVGFSTQPGESPVVLPTQESPSTTKEEEEPTDYISNLQSKFTTGITSDKDKEIVNKSVLETEDWYKERGGMTPFQKMDEFNKKMSDYLESQKGTVNELPNTEEAINGYNQEILNKASLFANELGLLIDNEGNISPLPNELESYTDRYSRFVEQNTPEEAEKTFGANLRDRFFAAVQETNANLSDLMGIGLGFNLLPGYKESNEYQRYEAELLRNQSTKYDRTIQDYIQAGEFGKAAGATATSVTEAIPAMIPAILNPEYGVYVMGATSGVQKYREIEDADIPKWKKLYLAGVTGLNEAIFERAFTTPILMKSKKAVMEMGEQQFKNNIKKNTEKALIDQVERTTKTTVPDFVKEGLSEVATGISNDIADKTLIDPTVKIGSHAIDDMIVGMAMGKIMSAPTDIVGAINREQAKKIAQKALEQLPDNINADIKSDLVEKVAERDILTEKESKLAPEFQGKNQERIDKLNTEIRDIAEETTGKPVEEVVEEKAEPKIEEDAKEIEVLREQVKEEGVQEQESVSDMREVDRAETPQEVTEQVQEEVVEPTKEEVQEEGSIEDDILLKYKKSEPNISGVPTVEKIDSLDDHYQKAVFEYDKSYAERELNKKDLTEDEVDDFVAEKIKKGEYVEPSKLYRERDKLFNHVIKSIEKSVVNEMGDLKSKGVLKTLGIDSSLPVSVQNDALNNLTQRIKNNDKQLIDSLINNVGKEMAESMGVDFDMVMSNVSGWGKSKKDNFIADVKNKVSGIINAIAEGSVEEVAVEEKPVVDKKAEEITDETVKEPVIKETEIAEPTKEYTSITQKLESIPEGEKVSEVGKEYIKIQDKLTPQEQANFKQALKVKQEVYKQSQQQKLEIKNKEADDVLSQGLDDLASLLGVKKEVTGEESPKVNDAIRNIAKGVSLKLEVKGEELIQAVRDYLTERKYQISDADIRKALADVKEFNVSREKVRGELIEDILEEEIQSLEPKITPESKEKIKEVSEVQKEKKEPVIKDKGVKKETAAQPKKKQHKLAERTLNAPDDVVRPEFKEGLSQRDTYYVPTSNEITNEEADAYMDSYEVEEVESIVRNTNNSLKPRVRGILTARVVKVYDDLANNTKDEAKADYYASKAYEMYDFLMKDLAYEWGAGIQMLGSKFANEILGARARTKRVNDAIKKDRDDFIEDNKKEFDEKKNKMNEINEMTIEEILNNPQILAEIMAKDALRKERMAYDRAKRTQAQIQKEKNYRKEQWDEFKKESAGTLKASLFGSKEGIEFIGNIIASYVREGYYRTNHLVHKLKTELKHQLDYDLTEKDIDKLLELQIEGKSLTEIEELGYLEEATGKKHNKLTPEARKKIAEVKRKLKPKAIFKTNKDGSISVFFEQSTDKELWSKYKKQAVDKVVKSLEQAKKDGTGLKDNPLLQDFVNALQNNLSNIIKEQNIQQSDKLKEARKKKSDIDVLIEVLRNPEKYQEVIDEARNEIAEKYKDNQELLNEFDAALENIPSMPFSEKLAEKATKELMTEDDVNIKDIIKQHYTVYDATKQSLIDKLVERGNLTKDEAKKVADVVGKAFDKIATKAKLDYLNKYKNRREKSDKKKSKAAWDDIIELSNMGAFSDAEFRKAFAEKYGFKEITKEEGNKIKELSDKAQESEEGFKKHRAQHELMKYIAQVQGVSPSEITSAIWYNNVLSGYYTQYKNIAFNTLNSIAEFVVSSINNPKEMPILFKGLMRGYIYQGKNHFKEAMLHGTTSIKQAIDTPSALEIADLKGWKKNLKHLDNVRKFMMAMDAWGYTAGRSMRLHQLAWREALEETGSRKEAFKKVNEMMGYTKDIIEPAKEQAAEEGLKGNDAKLRVQEIVEKNLKKEYKEDAGTFASRLTLNYPPEGLMGFITRVIEKATKGLKIPIGTKVINGRTVDKYIPIGKYIVPFTRVLANLTNLALDYTVVGATRAVRGEVGTKLAEKDPFTQGLYRKLTPEERSKVAIKAISGMMSTALFGLLSFGDDEDNVLYKWTGGKYSLDITADGFGDYQKNYNLKDRGWREYSIMLKNHETNKVKTWRYQNAPFIVALAPIGHFKDNIKYRNVTDENLLIGQMALAYLQGFTSVKDISFLSSIETLSKAVFSPNIETALDRVMKTAIRTVSSFVKPNLVNQLSKDIMDFNNIPMKDRPFLESTLLSYTPIARNNRFDKLNAFGEPIIPRGNIADIVKKRHENKYAKFVTDNGIGIAVPKRKSEQLSFYDPKQEVIRFPSDEEYYGYVGLRGKYIKEGLDVLMNKKGLNREDTQLEINKVVNNANKKAKTITFGWNIVKDKYPQAWYDIVNYNLLKTETTTKEFKIVSKFMRGVYELDEDELRYYNESVLDEYGKIVNRKKTIIPKFNKLYKTDKFGLVELRLEKESNKWWNEAKKKIDDKTEIDIKKNGYAMGKKTETK